MIKKILLLSFLFSVRIISAQDMKLIDSLLHFAHTTNQDTSKAKTYCELCWEYRFSDSTKSKKFAEKGIELSTATGFDKGKAQCLFYLGKMYEENSAYEKAIGLFLKCIEARKKTNELNRVGYSLSEIGTCYTKLGKYDLGLKNYDDALKIFEKFNNKNAIYNTNCAMGEVYYLDGNFKQSIKQLEDALAVSMELKDSLYISNAYMNLGLLYGESKDYKKGLGYLMLSLKISEALDQQESLESIYLNLGLLYAKLKDNTNAIHYYEKCLTIATAEKINEDVAIVLSNLSQAYIELGDYEKAIDYGERSLEMANSLHLKDKMKDATDNLAEANGKLGNYEKAFRFEKINSNLKDSLYTEERQTTIAEMQAKYDVDKKEKANQLLSQKVDLQKAESQQQRIILYSISFFAILIVALAFFIFRSYRQKKHANIFLEYQNNEILKQKFIIEEKNKDITDSINYAKRIQSAILPPIEEIQKYFPESFVLYQPKDIVSGDFYWFASKNDKFIFAVADCTGHGVPGAFMSMIGNDMLTQIIIEKGITQPNLILTQLHEGVKTALKQTHTQNETKDGMDIVLVSIDKKNKILEYAGAMRPLWIVGSSSEEERFIEIKADKQSIGGDYTLEERGFTNNSIELKSEDQVYLFSDGYADQFGGENGKKFMTKNMKELLQRSKELSMNEQKNILEKTLDDWKQDRQQVDDILVMGIKFS